MNVASVTADTSAGEPEVPMMFTKRATSIIPSGGKIYLHPHATRTVDYEGEMAIIIGKAGVNIKKADAWDHVWGATILNDVTSILALKNAILLVSEVAPFQVSARDRQKQHKQFYIGKSFDTFCPMGPFAVHSKSC
jgi:2-keto-4-pentenoate hydratase/2-oxohepta-3-ene-1,7-dioic acid hydratase in catechol pathway